MSYEGYDVNLCKNGHRFESGCWDEPKTCPFCKADIDFSLSVNQTNGDEEGLILEEDWDKFLVSKAEYKTCSECGCKKLLSHAVYKATRKELEQYQTLIHWETGKPVYVKDLNLYETE